MKMHSVESSNIHSIGYDSQNNILHVKYKSGGTYTYHGVTHEEVADLAQAPSVGKHMEQHIKPKYAGKKAEEKK